MASTLMVQCKCGQVFSVYVPKAVLYRRLLVGTQEEVSEWEAIDAEEEAQGEIEDSEMLAKAMGFGFVDGKQTETFRCQCGAEHHPLEAMHGKRQKTRRNAED